jgi:hypothetical protein
MRIRPHTPRDAFQHLSKRCCFHATDQWALLEAMTAALREESPPDGRRNSRKGEGPAAEARRAAVEGAGQVRADEPRAPL